MSDKTRVVALRKLEFGNAVFSVPDNATGEQVVDIIKNFILDMDIEWRFIEEDAECPNWHGCEVTSIELEQVY